MRESFAPSMVAVLDVHKRTSPDADVRSLIAGAGPLVLKYAKKYLYRSDQTLEDLVQHGLLELWRKADGYDPNRGSFTSWAVPVIRAALLKLSIETRGAVRIGADNYFALRAKGEEFQVNNAVSMQRDVSRDGAPIELQDTMESALGPHLAEAAAEWALAEKQLSAEMLPIVHLRAQGLDLEEVSKVTGIPRSTLEYRLCPKARAREKARHARLAEERKRLRPPAEPDVAREEANTLLLAGQTPYQVASATGLRLKQVQKLREKLRLAGVAPLLRVRGVCEVPGCGRPHQARGVCSAHYKQMMKK